MQAVKKYCTNCGEFISDTDKFCAICGASQNWEKSGQFYAAAHAQSISKGSVAVSGSQKADVQPAITPDKFIKRRQLSSPVIISFALSYIIKTSIILLLFLIGFVFEPFIFGLATILYLMVIVLVSLIVYNNFYFEIDEIGLTKWHGVLHKEEVTVPFQQIHNVNITRSIFDRILGLSRISIETAGSSDIESKVLVGGSSSAAEGHLPGIKLKDAKKIHDLLLAESQALQN